MAYGVKANIKATHRFLRLGSLCWIYLLNPGWANTKLQIIGRTRSGRLVETWIDSRDLENFRAGWLREGLNAYDFGTKEQAKLFAESMQRRFGAQEVRPHAQAYYGKKKGGEKSYKSE